MVDSSTVLGNAKRTAAEKLGVGDIDHVPFHSFSGYLINAAKVVRVVMMISVRQEWYMQISCLPVQHC